MTSHRYLLVAGAALVVAGSGTAQAPAKPSSKLTIEQLIQIKHPTGAQWTPDGSHIWFTYDSGGVSNIWAVPSDGSTKAVALTTSPEGQSTAGTFWSRDWKMFYYPRDGGLPRFP